MTADLQEQHSETASARLTTVMSYQQMLEGKFHQLDQSWVSGDGPQFWLQALKAGWSVESDPPTQNVTLRTNPQSGITLELSSVEISASPGKTKTRTDVKLTLETPRQITEYTLPGVHSINYNPITYGLNRFDSSIAVFGDDGSVRVSLDGGLYLKSPQTTINLKPGLLPISSE